MIAVNFGQNDTRFMNVRKATCSEDRKGPHKLNMKYVRGGANHLLLTLCLAYGDPYGLPNKWPSERL